MRESRLTQEQRNFVKQRAGGCCEYCFSQVAFSPDPFSIEHIVPRSKGGTSDLENLAIACQGCNNFKYSHVCSIDPVTGESAQLYHPRQDRWQEHFAWSDDFALLVGLTIVGRVTIERLQLNREGVVNLRRLLCAVDRHPPNQNP
jgi:HNH endonuclease